MRVKTVRLVEFKRFDDLTIDLGPTPKKIIALVGPNGCGKSSIFDAFEQQMQRVRGSQSENRDFTQNRFSTIIVAGTTIMTSLKR